MAHKIPEPTGSLRSSRILHALVFSAAVLTLAHDALPADALRPGPGDLFREYLWTNTTGDAGGSLGSAGGWAMAAGRSLCRTPSTSNTPSSQLARHHGACPISEPMT